MRRCWSSMDCVLGRTVRAVLYTARPARSWSAGPVRTSGDCGRGRRGRRRAAAARDGDRSQGPRGASRVDRFCPEARGNYADALPHGIAPRNTTLRPMVISPDNALFAEATTRILHVYYFNNMMMKY